MLHRLGKLQIIDRLKKDMLEWQGIPAEVTNQESRFGLGPIEMAFPNHCCPAGALHEFMITESETAAASAGFIAGMLKVLMNDGSSCLWVSTGRKVFPPALSVFGISPDKVIFIDLQKEKDILWVAEEALKCEGLTAVVAELREISFAQSRRMQLVVEKSKVTGFILRTDAEKITPTACAARWRISPLPSRTENGLPGIGYPQWKVELLKIKNGNPAEWSVQWKDRQFHIDPAEVETNIKKQDRKAG